MKRSDRQAVLRTLRELARRLPGAQEYVMVHHPAFRVGNKPFAVVGMDTDPESRPTVSVNLGRDAQLQLLADERFRKTPYIGQHGWVTAAFEVLPAQELSALVTESYRRVASKRLLMQHASASAPKLGKDPGAGSASSSRALGAKKAARTPRGTTSR